jgi:crotonobetainyl-CoA:carnitine CoA-transferase CaiB-like acyl-CoA transferase
VPRTTGADALPRPLAGVRVVDLSRVVSGPLCGRVLADLGAHVIKVEPPEGDRTRTVPPLVGGVSPYFAQMNAGKRNLCLDLKAPGACRVVELLAERADVLVENFRPGVMDRLGLGAERLIERNPRLVYCSITGWGQQGPWRERRAYAPLLHAEVGTIDFAARVRGRPPEQEVRVHGDVYPALVAANAVLAALLQRASTGVGQHLDVAMGEVMPYVDEWTGVDLQRARGYDDSDGNRAGFDIWTNRVFATADGTGVMFVGNVVRLFPAWVRALGGDDALLTDPRFATEDARRANEHAVVDVVAGLAARFPDFAALERALDGQTMLVAEVRSVADLAGTAWAERRGLTEEVLPGLPIPAAPWRSDGARVGVAGPPAAPGRHNREILAELGYTPEQIAQLEAAGALRS